MDTSPLDNPFWSSLCSRHRHLALHDGDVARYPPEFAPFLGVAEAGRDVAESLRVLVQPGETVMLLGALPAIPSGWRLETFRPLAQLTCARPIEMIRGPEIIELGEAKRGDVRELTALVYPHYFRERTMELGRYYGICRDARLAAMIGERLGTGSFTEMSAICTHPDFVGLGYARRLTAMLSNLTLDRGLIPFLHVSYENERALRLYRRLGYRLRSDIGFWALTRQPGSGALRTGSADGREPA